MLTLIPNWQSAWRFASVIAGLLLGFFDAAAAANFFGLLDALGPKWLAAINAFVAFVVIPGLRIVQQNPPVSPEVKEALAAKVDSLPTK